MNPMDVQAFQETGHVLAEKQIHEDLISRFRASCELLAEYAKTEGIEILPYESAALLKFRSLPLPQAKQICDSLVDYCETMTTIREQGEYLKYNLNAFWLTLRKAGLRSDNELFTLLDAKDVIEIYTTEGLQIFRSFHFFQYCSYDLETLFSTPWYELFHREPEHSQACADLYGRFLKGEVIGTETLTIPAHTVREHGSRRLTTVAYPRLAANVNSRDGNWRAFVHVFQAAPASNC